MSFCPKCGKAALSDASFCTACGTSLQEQIINLPSAPAILTPANVDLGQGNEFPRDNQNHPPQETSGTDHPAPEVATLPDASSSGTRQEKIFIPIGPNGVGGWLLFFCISLTFLVPLSQLASLKEIVKNYSIVYTTYPALRNLVTLIIPVNLSIAGFSLAAGIALWSEKPKSVFFAKRYLFYCFIASTLYFAAHLCIYLSPALVEKIIPELSKGMIGSLVYCGIWYLYLMKSKRVQNTYKEDLPSRDFGFQLGVVLVSIIVLIFLRISAAHTVRIPSASIAPIVAPTPSRFVSREGLFSVVFPGENALPEKGEKTYSTTMGSVKLTSFTIPHRESVYVVQYWDEPDVLHRDKTPEKLLKILTNGVMSEIKSNITGYENFNFDSAFPATRVKFSGMTEGTVIYGNCVLIIVNNRIYIIISINPTLNNFNDKLFNDFFDSFRLIDNSSHI